MNKVTFKIEGMRCESCAKTIQTAVSGKAGVRAAEVSFQGKEARVLYDPATIDEDRLVRLVERAGFQVVARQS